MQVETLALPLPKNRFRKSKLFNHGGAVQGLAARVAQSAQDVEFAASDTALDGAQKLFDSLRR